MCWIIFWSVYFLIWAYICWSVYQTFYLSILWKGKGRFGKEKLRWRHKGGASLKEWDVSTTSGTQQHNITNNKRNSNKLGLSQGAPRKNQLDFAKGLKHPIYPCTRMLLLLKSHSDGLLRLGIPAVNPAHPVCPLHLLCLRPDNVSSASYQGCQLVSTSGASYQWCQLVCCTTH